MVIAIEVAICGGRKGQALKHRGGPHVCLMCSCRTLGPEELSAAFLTDSPGDTGAVSPAGPAVTPVHSEIVSALGSPSKSLREGVAAGTLRAWT